MKEEFELKLIKATDHFNQYEIKRKGVSFGIISLDKTIQAKRVNFII